MKTKLLAILFVLLAAAALLLTGQQRDISGIISSAEKPSIAVIDFRGAGEAQRVMIARQSNLPRKKELAKTIAHIEE